jgi:alpha-N-arabinofuranosidase
MIENFGGVVWAVTFLNTMIRNGARIASASPNGFMHGGGVKKAAGVVYTEPLFDTIQEYSPLVGGNPLPVRIEGPSFDVDIAIDLGAPERDVPFVDALAVQTEDGTVHLTLANRDETSARAIVVDLDVCCVVGPVAIRRFAEQPIETRLDPFRPDAAEVTSTSLEGSGGSLVVELPPLGTAWVSIPATSLVARSSNNPDE